MKYCFSGLRHV